MRLHAFVGGGNERSVLSFDDDHGTDNDDDADVGDCESVSEGDREDEHADHGDGDTHDRGRQRLSEQER
eukprot:764419-Hanusia_phi.AAC.7